MTWYFYKQDGSPYTKRLQWLFLSGGIMDDLHLIYFPFNCIFLFSIINIYGFWSLDKSNENNF